MDLDVINDVHAMLVLVDDVLKIFVDAALLTALCLIIRFYWKNYGTTTS